MKPIHMLCLTLLSSAVAHAQEMSVAPSVSEGRKTVLGVAITPNEWSVVTLEGERVVSPRVSLGLGLRTGLSRREGDSGLLVNGEEPETINSTFLLGVVPRARFFLVGDAPEGLWVSPQVEVTRMWSRYEQEWAGNVTGSRTRTWHLGMTGLLGYTVILGRGLAVQAGVGAGVWRESSHSTLRGISYPDGEVVQETEEEDSRWGLDERMMLSLGWAF
ncbi:MULTISPECIES: hypothetical protein [Myxococcus]|uniref:hypothetical protein n=1 Tax=Myxococcus TaxID=32 RepID=UPI0013D3B9D5|nr:MULTISPECIES: hypothetical protein [Myxococcus]NVJ26421.1 hypothetical protein [Myxococcus sp. AM011]